MRARVSGVASATWADRLQVGAIWIVLALLFLLASALSEVFLRPIYILNLIRQAAPVGITALGVTLVMILGGVDLSVGAVISLTAVMCAVLMDGQTVNLAPAVALTCLAGAGVGLVNGAVIAFNRVSPFIVTLGMAIAVYGLTLIYSGGTARGEVSPGFREFFNHRVGGVAPVLALAFLGLAALMAWLQDVTRFGRMLFLIGSNPSAARLCGLPTAAVTLAAYALSGLFAALGGMALLARAGVSSTYVGRGLEFDVLAAVVLGGTTFQGGRGGVGGTVAGVLVLVIAFNLVNILGLSFHAQLMVKGAIIIAASAAYEYLHRYQ
jgi:ribose/xylose/arabinose/galactoside ABC-type transport system permease subunit